ncbi:MAG: T9SS type A sorting domain-containing protein [Flavobacteriales bacterium]|nr:T9SS type A sorting domain-containing protein [Flavobacteriales bacterium]
MNTVSTLKNLPIALVLGLALLQSASAQTWTLMDETFTQSMKEIEFFDENTGIVSRGYAMNTTSDGGTSWGSDIDFTWTVNALKYTGGSTLFLGTGNGTIFKSVDGGANWSQIGGYIVSDIRSMAFNGSNGIVVDNNCKIAWTSNGGDSWTAIPSDDLCGNLSRLDHVDMPSSTVAYAGGNNGYMFKSTDGGQTWTAITSLPAEFDDMSGMSFPTTEVGYITGSVMNENTALVLKTTDGGANWTDISAGLTQSISDIFAVNATTVYVGAGGNKIYKSTDGGDNWAVDYTHPVCTQCAIKEFDLGGTTLYALFDNGGEHKKIVKLANATVGINDTPDQNTFSVRPNPSNGIFSITFQKAPVQLDVYDVLGNLLFSKGNLSLTNVQLDLSHLSKGIYVMKAFDGTGASTQRLVID